MFFNSAPKTNTNLSPIKNLLRTNLLTKKGEAIPFHIKLFRWLLSSGRYIVIVVEMIVIGAFVYRYKLDSDLISLKEEISQQSAYVQSLKNDEDIIRLTQFQLASVKEVKQKNLDYPSILLTIARLTPQNIRLTSINVSSSQASQPSVLSITGDTPSNAELSAFIKALQKDPTFEAVSLSNISFEGSTNFTITGELRRVQKELN